MVPAHVGAVDTALQQAPEVLHSVRVDLPINVRFVVDYLMGEVIPEALVRLQRIAVQRRSRFNGPTSESTLPAGSYHVGANPSAALQNRRLDATLTIGGKPATLLYSGTAPFQIPGIIQVIPDGLSSGPQPIVLTTGGLDNASQNATVAIQ